MCGLTLMFIVCGARRELRESAERCWWWKTKLEPNSRSRSKVPRKMINQLSGQNKPRLEG